MKTLQVQMCVYKAPEGERLGILMDNNETAIIVDFARREIIKETVEFKALPGEGSFNYTYGYTPEMRKTIKDSRRLARAQ